MPRNPFRRSTAVPDDALARAGLSRRVVLAGAAARSRAWLLGTREAFWVVPPDERPVVRVPWEQVHHADWDRETDRFRLLEVATFGQVSPEHVFVVAEPGTLLQLVRERVTASVLLQRRVAVDETAGLLVVARRPPTGAGEITWTYELDPGLDPADPRVRRPAERGLRSAADEIGL